MPQQTTNGGQIDTNWIDGLQSIFQRNLESLFEIIFTSVSSILHNGVAYSVIGMVVMFWLLNRLKQGYPTREEIFGAIKWLILVCFIFGIFYSYEAYTEFLGWLILPAQWLKGAVSDLFGAQAQSFGEVITDAINKINMLRNQIWNYALNHNTEIFTPDIGIIITAFLSMIGFWIFYLLFFCLIFGVSAIIIVSIFITMVILSIAPILIPLLALPFTKPYFFSWLKLFISYSLYAPASYVILALCMKPIKDIEKIQYNTTIIQQLYENQFTNFLLPSLIAIIGIYMLKQIPNWISQILGVQGLGAGGSGGIAQTAGAFATGASTFGAGFIAKKLTGGNLQEALKQGAINATPFGRATQELIKGLGQNSKIDNITGAIASPSY